MRVLMRFGSAGLSDNDGQNQAAFTTTSLSASMQNILAIYSGDSSFLGSAATLLQTVNVALPSWQGPSYNWSVSGGSRS